MGHWVRGSWHLGLRFGVVVALVGGFLAVSPAERVHAASLDSIPDRLYMAPDGATLPGDIPAELVGLAVGTLPFDHTDDLIVQHKREIVVTATEGPIGCTLELSEDLDAAPDYNIDDCTRIVLTTNIGRLKLDDATLDYRRYTSDPDGAGPLQQGSDNLTEWVWIVPGGAVIDAWGNGDEGTDWEIPPPSDPPEDPFPGNPNDPDGFGSLEILGDTDMLNTALENLVYTPPDDYHYTDGSTEASITVSLAPGDPADPQDPDPHTIDIRVLDVNGFPEHDGPAMFPAEAAIEEEITGFSVIDEDNDEVAEGDHPDSPDDDNDDEELPDGANVEMLLIAWLTCLEAIAPNTGFHIASADMVATLPTVAEIFADRLDPTPSVADEWDEYTDLVLEGLDEIEPGLTGLTLQTSESEEWTTAYGGIGTITAIRDALSTITFRHDAPDDECTLITVVSDLGNNGLPLQWIADPPPEGFEIPMIGFDWNVLTITTADLQEIEVDFEPDPIVVYEGDGPIEAPAALHISPADHPGFTIAWGAVPRYPDDVPIVPGSGLATPSPEFESDFSGTYGLDIIVPPGVTEIPIDSVSPDPPVTTVFDDTRDEGDETFEYRLIFDEHDPPDGWVFAEPTVPTKTVLILDDDDADKEVVSVSNASVTEGDVGQTTMSFTVQLSGPADGDESFVVTTTDGSATSPADYVAIVGETYTFEAGQQTLTIDVTVEGDTIEEDDPHTFTLTIASPQNVTLGPDTTGTGSIDDDDAPDPDPVIVSVSDPTVDEGDAGTTPLTFTLTLGETPVGDEQVTVNTSGATPGVDYEPLVDEVVTFQAGVATLDVVVLVNGDTDVEPDDLVTLTLSNPINATIGDPTGVGTIENDDVAADPVPEASITDVSIAEGDSGTTNLVFTVTLSAAAEGGETIDYTTVDGSATAAAPDPDYAAASGTLVFQGGDMSAQIVVPINGDVRVEPDETFDVTLGNASGLTIAGSQATGTITNDDAPSVVSIADTTIIEGNIGPITVSMTNPVRTCEVEVTTVDDVAVAPGDFAALDGVGVTLAAVASATINLTTVADGTAEGAETLFATIVLADDADPDCDLGTSSATVTIDDTVTSTPEATVADVAVVEGSGGTTNLVFTITLTGGPVIGTETIAYTTVDGTAAAGTDYVATADTATFGPGVTTFPVTVVVNGDYQVESDETLTLELTDPVGVDIVDAVGQGTITDDDEVSVIDIDDALIPEGSLGQITVRMTNFTGRTCDVEVTTTGLSATAPGDYTELASEPLSLLAVASGTVGLDTVSDATPEGPETLTAEVALAPGADPDCTLGDAAATITIDDTPGAEPTASVADASVDEGDVGTTDLTFTILLSAAADGDVTIDYTTADVTATGGVDYVPASGTATIPDGQSSASVTVTVDGDHLVEPDETFALTLVNPSGATLGVPTATGTITNDDEPSVITVTGANIQEGSTGQITVSMTNPDGRNCGLTVTTVNGSATAPGDFTALAAEVLQVLADGSGAVLLATIADGLPEGVESLTATIAVAAGSDVDCQLAVTTVTVTIFDLPEGEEPLTLDLPADITRPNDPGEAGAVVTWPAVTANGGVAPVTIVCSETSGDFFALGTVTVTCTATDSAPSQEPGERFVEAVTVGTFTVTVIDTEPPVIADLPDLVRTTGGTGVIVTFPLPTATDNSGVPPTVACAAPSGTFFPLGVTTVTCTATDGAGNSASSSFTITVTTDGTSPPVTPPAPPPGTPTPNLPRTGGQPARAVVLGSALVVLGLFLRRRRYAR